jgi:hypothetical protein
LTGLGLGDLLVDPIDTESSRSRLTGLSKLATSPSGTSGEWASSKAASRSGENEPERLRDDGGRYLDVPTGDIVGERVRNRPAGDIDGGRDGGDGSRLIWCRCSCLTGRRRSS